ncbi:hypothetical protein [Parapedobacter sp. 2B3]|uniref:hypothetical protein n=1 Tax=Parapedobacter sp. 2B3 TaxID=3342381 RepID=UPI0035B63F00
MANLNKELIRKNIFKLLDYSGLTDLSFADLLDVSEKQIRRIKKGAAEFSINDINKACDFFRKSFASINRREIEADRMFRDKLITQHKGNPEYSTILEKRPSITYAINFELLYNENFRKKGLGISKISQLFEARGWKFSSAYISLAMVRNADRIKRIRNLERKGWYVYTVR